MTSVKEITAQLMKTDLYELLEIESTADEKAIKKAYRRKALKCHPDKNPDDAKAAELFLRLSKTLEILCDPEARKTYDSLLKARAAAALRNRELDSKRQKLKAELEARERAAESRQTAVQRDTARLQAEIERLRRQGSRQLEEEQRLMREQLQRERQSRLQEAEDEAAARVKLRWDGSASAADSYDPETLRTIFSKYGAVTAVVMSKKKKGSALLEFSDSKAALLASKLEKGLRDNPLRIELLGTARGEPGKPVATLFPAARPSPAPAKPQMSKAGFDTFEAMVLKNLRQAQGKKEQEHNVGEEETYQAGSTSTS